MNYSFILVMGCTITNTPNTIEHHLNAKDAKDAKDAKEVVVSKKI